MVRNCPSVEGLGPGKGKKPGADAHQCENADRLEIDTTWA